MSNRILAGATLVVWAENEALRSEVFALLSIEGWQAHTELPEDESEFVTQLKKNPTQSIAVILEPHSPKLDRLLQIVNECGYNKGQVIVGSPPASLVHRMLGRQGFSLIQFSQKRTPIGPKIEVEGLQNAILRVWKAHFSMQLDSEIKASLEHGTLPLLAALTGVNSTGILKERAHLAYALGQTIKVDLEFLKRVARFALYSDLSHHPMRDNLVKEIRCLWPIRDLLVFDCEGSQLPLEIGVVEIAKASQAMSGSSLEEFRSAVKKITSEMSLELRVSLKMNAEACFQRIWVGELNAA